MHWLSHDDKTNIFSLTNSALYWQDTLFETIENGDGIGDPNYSLNRQNLNKQDGIGIDEHSETLMNVKHQSQMCDTNGEQSAWNLVNSLSFNYNNTLLSGKNSRTML